MLEKYSDILEVKDISEILMINKKTAYQLLKSGEIPYRRIGRVYRISKDSVIQFLSK